MKILVFTGSFTFPIVKAKNAVGKLIPHNSNRTTPPFILTPQCVKFPFPFSILTSVGFDVIGKSGKILIQSLPFLLIFLTIARLADSIRLKLIIPDSIVFKPILP